MTRPNLLPPDSLTETVMEYIWHRTLIEPSGCIRWVGSLDTKGYGRARVHLRTVAAHRVTYVWATGEDIEPGFYLDHLCRNKSCVNPEHLEPVTTRENIRRGIAAGAETIRLLELSGICSRGHSLTGPNPWVYSTDGKSRQCRQCVNDRDRVWRRRKAEDPEWRERQRARSREYARFRSATDPEWRARNAAAQRRYRAKKRQNATTNDIDLSRLRHLPPEGDE